MIKKKICMVGVFAVGKTSLVQRFVKSLFSDKYLTTVGVKIDKKSLRIGEEVVDLMLWDLQGEDEFQSLQVSYLRGSSGYFLVADGTREWTLDRAMTLQQKVQQTVGDLPFMLLINKADLSESWEIDEKRLSELVETGWSIMRTSARTGQGVEEAFNALAIKMLEAQK
jgi:small GTP-binding protein